MWLPTFIGQNTAVLGELDRALRTEFVAPFEADDERLDEIHNFVIEWLGGKFKINGLKDYLRAVALVSGD